MTCRPSQTVIPRIYSNRYAGVSHRSVRELRANTLRRSRHQGCRMRSASAEVDAHDTRVSDMLVPTNDSSLDEVVLAISTTVEK